MLSIIIAVVVAAFAGGVVGWIAGVAKGMALMEDAVRVVFGDKAIDEVFARTGRGKVPPPRAGS